MPEPTSSQGHLFLNYSFKERLARLARLAAAKFACKCASRCESLRVVCKRRFYEYAYATLVGMAETASNGPVFETLDVKLTPEQVEARRIEMEHKLDSLRSARTRLKEEEESTKARLKFLKAEADALEAKVWELRGIARSGKELQPVECLWTIDQATGVARLVRQDTGEVVRERALLASERQVKLFPINGGKADAH